MGNDQPHIDDLIARVLAREATPEQEQALDAWKGERPENQRYFEDFRTIFEGAANLPDEHFDADTAWNRVRRRIRRPHRDGRMVTMLPPVWRMAAAVLLLLTAGFLLNRWLETQTVEEPLIAAGTILRDTLPGGTAVVLNRQTTLAHKDDGGQRIVTLAGEAYFDIEEEPGKVFVVLAGDTRIRDIGTSFNVRAYPDSATIEVSVQEGEVVFYTEADPGVRLRAGEKGVYDKMTKRFQRTTPAANEIAYKTRIFIFNNQTLRHVAQTLSAVYDRELRVEEAVAGCRITVSFRNESLEEISAVIAETLNLTLRDSSATILLTGDACLQ